MAFHRSEFNLVVERGVLVGECGTSVVTISGTGTGTLECRRLTTSGLSEPRALDFSVSPDEIKSLLELLYNGGFFDLRESYPGPYDVRVDDLGTVRVGEIRIHPNPARHNRYVVQIGSYTKQVVLGAGAVRPCTMTELEQRLDRLAEPALEQLSSER
ncbi:MAG: hypothetical protein JXA57_13800 [Armatimonadetes bacterium]|nr:hypothetical protein [Armatimonadota bacterium]